MTVVHIWTLRSHARKLTIFSFENKSHKLYKVFDRLKMAGDNQSAESRQIMLDPTEEQPSPCDWSSFSYFLLSFLLFAVGAILTFLSIDESNASNPFTRFWLVGPLFLCSGLVMASKTLIYLKSKNLIELLTRQSELCISNNDPNWYAGHDVNEEALRNSLPPPYETAVANSNSSIYIAITPHSTSGRNSRQDAIRPASANAGLVYESSLRETTPTPNKDELNPNVLFEQPPPPYELAVKW